MARTLSLNKPRYPIHSIIIKISAIINYFLVINYYTFIVPNKLVAKLCASILFLAIICLVLRYINGYTTFTESFKYGFLLWTVVNLYDVIILDIIWFCHDKHFVFKGTEDMVNEYHNYWFHIKGFFIGELLAVVICLLAGLIIQFVL